jgi:hypothetical protein
MNIEPATTHDNNQGDSKEWQELEQRKTAALKRRKELLQELRQYKSQRDSGEIDRLRKSLDN